MKLTGKRMVIVYISWDMKSTVEFAKHSCLILGFAPNWVARCFAVPKGHLRCFKSNFYANRTVNC